MSPDVLLSQLGIRYDCLPGTPDSIAKTLITLTAAYAAGTYRTPGFHAVPVSPASFDPKNTERARTLMATYLDALHWGRPVMVHSAVDAINKLRMVMSGTEMVPPPDFEILAHGQNALGAAARWIISEYVYAAFFDAHGDAIRKYAAGRGKS